ncbi:hypothetical protein LPJ75_002943 [Coemansia sp. RSA 2598]|nr:hypothetical protein LPJ75_002943 [Coemansia sp. RSA 2598]
MAMFGRHLEAIRGFAPEEIVCYGMGSPSSSQVSQWQLALILEINDVFKLPVLAFDPVTSDCDIEVLSKLGVSAIPENEEAKRRASRKTLFFMPHCEQFLYENVVAANWSKETLGRVMVVGNRFSGYRDAQGGQEFADKSPHLARMIDSVTVIEFPSEKALKLRHCPYAFTDTSIQFIEPEKISLIKF